MIIREAPAAVGTVEPCARSTFFCRQFPDKNRSGPQKCCMLVVVNEHIEGVYCLSQKLEKRGGILNTN